MLENKTIIGIAIFAGLLLLVGYFNTNGFTTFAIASAPPQPSMVNLITWSGSNGYSSVNWNALTEITIFHVIIAANGGLTYDGGTGNANPATIIPTAHSHGVLVCIGVGGSGDTANQNAAIATSAARAVLINNILAQINQYGYDCVHSDLETDNPGNLNGANYVLYLQQLRSALPSSIIIDCSYADWMGSSTPAAQMNPYCTHMLIDYPSSYTASYLATQAAEAGGASKLMVGYDLSTGDQPYAVPTAAQLSLIKSAGYGVYFWQAGLMTNQTIYNQLLAAGFGSSGATTITTSVTSSSTTISTTSTTTSTNPTTTSCLAVAGCPTTSIQPTTTIQCDPTVSNCNTNGQIPLVVVIPIVIVIGYILIKRKK